MEVEHIGWSTAETCGCCESWIEHYERNGGVLGPVCSTRGCCDRASVLAAVRSVSDPTEAPVLVPMCGACHRAGKLHLKGDSRPIPVVLPHGSEAAEGAISSRRPIRPASLELRPLAYVRRRQPYDGSLQGASQG